MNYKLLKFLRNKKDNERLCPVKKSLKGLKGDPLINNDMRTCIFSLDVCCSPQRILCIVSWGEGGKIRSSSCVHKKPFPSITNSSSIDVQDKTSRIEGKQCQSQILPLYGCNSFPPTSHIIEMLWKNYKIIINDNHFAYDINVSLLILGGSTLTHCSCRRQDRRALNARYRRTMDRCWMDFVTKKNSFQK